MTDIANRVASRHAGQHTAGGKTTKDAIKVLMDTEDLPEKIESLVQEHINDLKEVLHSYEAIAAETGETPEWTGKRLRVAFDKLIGLKAAAWDAVRDNNRLAKTLEAALAKQPKLAAAKPESDWKPQEVAWQEGMKSTWKSKVFKKEKDFDKFVKKMNDDGADFRVRDAD